MIRPVSIEPGLCAQSWAFTRLVCHIRAVDLATARGIDLDLDDLARIEDTVRRMVPAFDRPGQDHHFITVQYRRQRFTVLYNIRQGYILTVGIARPLVNRPKWMVPENEVKTLDKDFCS